MANDDDKPPPPPQPPVWVPDQMWDPPPMRRNNALFESQPAFVPPPLQQPVWAPEPWWPQPQPQPILQRFPGLYTQQANDLPPAPEPPLPPAVSSATLSGASTVMVTGRAEITLTGAPGVTAPANAREGDIEARFQEALRHAADLTSLIDQLRRASTAREIGPGHNLGPPLQDLDQVDDLIALFRDEGPRVKTAVDAKALIEQTEKVKRLPERIWRWLTAAGLLVVGVGVREVTKDLTAPLWEDVAHRIVDLCHAIEVWVSLLPPM